ncbi:L-ribulose-5-phosphate 3-epimerase UlaE [Rubripirellula lacrimiformis]|uniref:L-ribulose-5-phosphate 3-epimerase UlaE n=1 Tax=Rubripirellula lacrimiformis TaxID=1930273 RepID=A0A517NFN7_9BACT|nr:sugar phosphate isomerase/epimerase family protein [Rubripirellula lacrimiformis]QDT05923.1 L-ribulose-5-phosphate 3-epimerase UlaE [Rubripirellula lacrimiformis]
MSTGPFAQNRGVSRRDALLSGLAVAGAAGAAIAADGSASSTGNPPDGNAAADERRQSKKKYSFRKSINQWAFPYPDRMNLRECMQLAKRAGFDGIELNYDLDNDLSPKASNKQLAAIRHMADEIGIEISGLCSFLFWPYPLSSNDPAKRNRGIELAGMMADAANQMGVQNLLVVPGAVHIPWRDDHEPVPNDVCLRRAKDAIGGMVRKAEKSGVSLNMENIFFNGFLMTPMEMNQFVDGFGSEAIQVHYDTGNISMFQFAEHWIPIMGDRIQNVHFKEFTKKGTDYSLETFRPLLDGTTNWPAVMEELDKIHYDGFVTFEYFHPYPHYPEALIYQTSDSLDRMLGRLPDGPAAT